VTDEDPNELRPSLSADVLTEDDRPRRAVRDRQQACHPPLSDARRRGRSGGPDRSARHGERPASIPTLLLSQSGQQAGSGVATPGCDEDDVYRVDVSPEDRFHSKGAPHVSRQAGKRDARSVPQAGVIPTCPLGTSSERPPASPPRARIGHHCDTVAATRDGARGRHVLVAGHCALTESPSATGGAPFRRWDGAPACADVEDHASQAPSRRCSTPLARRDAA
jgi:hypothetical protein